MQGTIQDSVPSTQTKMGKASRAESTPSDRLPTHGAPFEIEITGQIQEPIPEQGAVSFQVYIPSTVRSYRQGELGRRGWGHLTGGIGNSPRA